MSDHPESHLSDQELLLAVDGELAPHDRGRVESHLAACWTCRVRKQELETAIGEFVHFHEQSFSAGIPPPDGPRALLKAQLARLAQPPPSPWRWFTPAGLGLALAAALLVMAAITSFLVRDLARSRRAHYATVTIPNPNLTPGATVLLSQSEVCMEPGANNKAVPVALQRLVFDEYGLGSASPRAYEVDYLITPALGGADDIRNLWPQSNSSTVWNAQVKDALEDHLRGLVCEGRLDLATAQRELASNWIEAYKKYFHTDRPLTLAR